MQTYVNVQNTNELWATFIMYAEETEWDWTTAEGWDRQKVWDGDHHRVKEIVSVDSDQNSYDTYTDTDHAEGTIWQSSSELVDRFEVVGDTDGDEAGTETGIQVYFNNPVKLTVLR